MMSPQMNQPNEEVSRQTKVQDSTTATSSENNPQQPKFRFLTTLWQSFPTIVILFLLGGIAFLGDHWEWKIPKLSEILGNHPVPEEKWCTEHGVPAAICIACNNELMPKDKLYGWCDKHGIAECVFEHPQLAQLRQTPEILQADLDRAERALKIIPRKKNDRYCKKHLRRIQFVSAAAVEKAGVDIQKVERLDIEESIRVNGEIRYDPTLVARLSSRTAGTIWSVEKKIGDSVRRGDVLALVDAAEVGRVKADLLQAVAQLDLQTKLFNQLSNLKEVVAGRRLQEAEAAMVKDEVTVKKSIQTLSNLGLQITFEETQKKSKKELTEKLRYLGIPKQIVVRLQQASTNLIPVFSPRDGVIVKRDATAGEVIRPSKTLFTVVDTNRMWLVLNIPLETANLIKLGQDILFQPDGDTQTYLAKLTWISTEVDRETRTLEVRAELSNQAGHLRNESFGTGRIILRQEKKAIVVPQDAVHWEGCCHIVFVRDKNFLEKDSYKVFHTRMVRPGITKDGFTEIIAGLLPDEWVVIEGGGVLRAELLKGNLGEG